MYDRIGDDRLSPRHAVLLQARCRKSLWNVFPVELADFSQGGCCIVGSSEAFLPGEHVQLRIAHLKPIEAQVRWLKGDYVGVEFHSALPARTSADLGRIYGITVARESRLYLETDPFGCFRDVEGRWWTHLGSNQGPAD